MKKLPAASLLLCALSLGASARQRTLEHRQGDAFHGPVKSARVEQASFSRADGALVEGPRRLLSEAAYTPDGRRKEQVSYAPDGTPRGRHVSVYDAAGNEVEASFFDGGGNLQMKVVRYPPNEKLIYNGDGSLREREVLTRLPNNDIVEINVYDGGGALKERSVNARAGRVSVWNTYGPGGALKKSAEHGPGDGGQIRHVEQTYNPDGSVYGRRVADVAPALTDIRAVNDGYNPGPRKTRETREYDSRKNLSKITSYVWNEAAGEYEPVSVSYYALSYYR